MKSIQTSTIKVPKDVLENIKIYCNKNGKQVGSFVETAWNFIEKNDLDIYDLDATPCLLVHEYETSKIEVLTSLMANFISVSQKAQQQIPNLQQIAQQSKELGTLQAQNEALREWKEKAIAEFHRIEEEQKVIGKIRIQIP